MTGNVCPNLEHCNVIYTSSNQLAALGAHVATWSIISG